jgi:hypothetical protein
MGEVSDVISPMPRSFPRQLAKSPLRSAFASTTDLQRLCAVLEVFLYNTPVKRFGREYRLIRDTHGGCLITQDGVIVASGNLSENEDAKNA